MVVVAAVRKLQMKLHLKLQLQLHHAAVLQRQFVFLKKQKHAMETTDQMSPNVSTISTNDVRFATKACFASAGLPCCVSSSTACQLTRRGCYSELFCGRLGRLSRTLGKLLSDVLDRSFTQQPGELSSIAAVGAGGCWWLLR